MPFGEIEHKNLKIIGLKEKPEYDDLINAGIYVF